MNKNFKELAQRVSALREDTLSRGETFYPGPSRINLASFPPIERWDDWVELDSRQWPKRVESHYMLVPTTCFNCESACGLLAYVNKETLQVKKFEGNPEHPGSRGRNCAKGPATINQITDPDRILYPLKRVGKRGEGKWVRTTWDEALDNIAATIRRTIEEKRQDEIICHIGRPGEDGFTERVLGSWGVDGHNSHTNVCSSGGRTGYQFWTGIDRPSPDYANAKVILNISSHLETGHYFNPHAQRIMDAKQNGAKLIVLDTRLSNTATHADYWLSTYPGSEAAVMLSIANYLIQNDLYNKEYVQRWWNWQEYLEAERPDLENTFENFEKALKELYVEYSFEYAAKEAGIEASVIAEVAEVVSSAGTRLSTHNWRSAAASNLGGWQVSRTLFLLNALMGAVATEGGFYPNAWNKFVPRPIHATPHPHVWNNISWPIEFPLAQNELSFLMPHLMKENRGHLEVYFNRVYNPVWTNPDGFSWIEMLTDETKVGTYVCLTPTWNESAFFADYVLPMGHASERHDTFSYEQYNGQWLGFRQPVLRAAREKLGEKITDTRQVNPGEVWEENEFWIDLSWRIDPDGSMGIRQYHESKKNPGTKLSIDEYYSWMFENSVPGLPEHAASQGLTPFEYMRKYGVFQIQAGMGQPNENGVHESELKDLSEGPFGRIYSGTPAPLSPNIAPVATPDPDPQGRRALGVKIGDSIKRGFPTPSGRLEFYSSTLANWGWKEYAIPTYIKSHVHKQELEQDQMVLLSTFRLPTQIHTRSANSKWLDEISHTNPVMIHPQDANPRGISSGDLVRVETEIGYYVGKALVTEGIHPGVAACSHHFGRWKTNQDEGQNQMMRTVGLDKQGDAWSLKPLHDVHAYNSSDPDTLRIWWNDVGVHQNLTFPVHPDPISGMHCWHQAVRVRKADPGDKFSDIYVDTKKAHEVYQKWMEKTRSATKVSPDGNRRPYWLQRPLKPPREIYALPKAEPVG